MSEYASYNYQLEQQKRRELYLEQIRGNVTQRLQQFQEELEEMNALGISQYIEGELGVLQNYVDEMQHLVLEEPERAYQMGRGLLRDLSRLRITGERVKEEVLKKQAQNLLKECQKDLSNMDIVTQDFASSELTGIVRRLQEIRHSPNPENLKEILILRKTISEIIEKAEEKAAQWTEEREQATVDLREMQYQVKEAEQIKGGAAQAEKSVLQEQLKEAQEALQKNNFERVRTIAEDSEKQLEKAHEQALEENVRREVLKAVVKSLKYLGFYVGKPKVVANTNDEDQVVLIGKKASGQEARFEVKKNGQMSFKFDHYVGMACKKDIQQVQDKLQEIYGIKLSQERVLWQNPDKISKGSKPLPKDHHKKS